jgi:tRNA uridine 5-carbamoylmethylation protein Kti12
VAEMPLVIFTGLPSAKKADAVEALVKYFEEVVCVNVTLVREVDFVTDARLKRGMRIYLDSKAERELRGKVKAEVVRLVSNDRLVVLDGLNSVKGQFCEWLSFAFLQF